MLSKQQRTEYETNLKQALPESYTELACHVSSDGSISFQVNDTLQKLVNYSFKYGKLSKGCFTMGIEPVSSLWDFSDRSANCATGRGDSQGADLCGR